jgi:site-specific DNA-methyltransferase (adenine-specific)/modification methylase
MREPDYQRDGITLYCGDCMEIFPVLDRIDAVITDPPYGVNFAGSATKCSTRNGQTYDCFDDTPLAIETEIIPRFVKAISMCKSAAVTPGLRCARLYPTPSGEGVIWYPAGANAGPWGFVTHQPIYYYGKCPYLARGKGSRPTGFQTNEVAERNGHPCPKPIGQMTWLVERASWDDDVVLDPFMGSGTTGVACVRLNRRFVGIEKSSAYFDIAVKRIDAALNADRNSLFPVRHRDSQPVLFGE